MDQPECYFSAHCSQSHYSVLVSLLQDEAFNKITKTKEFALKMQHMALFTYKQASILYNQSAKPY